MKNMKTMMSSENDSWETPDDLFNFLHKSFRFTVDAAANESNAKLPRFFTVLEDGREANWSGETVWCNPPYGRDIGTWASKFVAEHVADRCHQIVALVPSRTDAKWFQQCMLFARTVTFVSGRLKFKGAQSSAPFPSALFTFGTDPTEEQMITLSTLGAFVGL